jgi:hypothetical protein
MGGLGNGIQKVASIEWLQRATVLYWGDCDAAGFGILGRLRARLPNVVSVLMDQVTLDSYRRLAIPDRTNLIVTTENIAENLTADEQATLLMLISSGERLEQEKLPVELVHAKFKEVFASKYR